MLAAFMFACSAALCVWIFASNKDLALAKAAADENPIAQLEPIARCRDFASKFTFVAALVFVLLALVSRIYLDHGAK